MKRSLLLIFICIYSVHSSAQLFSIKPVIGHNEDYSPLLGEEIANGGTFTISKLNYGSLDGYAVLINISEKDINLKVKATREKLTHGSIEQFCLELCYTSNEMQIQYYPPTGEFILEAGSEKEISFHCVLGEEGENIIKYEFYDLEDAENDLFALNVIYKEYTSDIKENSILPLYVSQLSEGVLEFICRENSPGYLISIYDLTGKAVVNFNLIQNNYRVHLDKGIYIYSLTNILNNTIETHKVTIK